MARKARIGPIGILVAAATIVLLALGGCSKSPNDAASPKESKVSVRFPLPIVEAGQTTFYVAQDKGYFAEEGLNVKFEMGSRELNPVKTVASEQDDFGVLGGPDTLLVARSRQQPLRAIAVIHRNSNFACLIALKSSGITKVEQLQDKKIGFYYGHISTDVLRNLLRKKAIRYTEVDTGFDYNQLVTGKIDAEWGFTVTAGLELPAKGVAINIISPADYGIVTHGYTIFATEKTIREKPDLVLRFLRAVLKGVRYTLENTDDALSSLLKRDPSLDRELNLKRQKAYNAVTSNSEAFPAGYMDREMFQETYDRLVEEKVIETPFDVSKAYTTEFLEKIYRRPFDK
jgi:NitT/TauT family transport system substrate-binding protein